MKLRFNCKQSVTLIIVVYLSPICYLRLSQCFPTFFVGGLIPNLPKSLRTQNATMKATSHRVWLIDNVTSLNHNLSEEATKQTQ